MKPDYILDKRQLRNAFERAAASYNQAAVLQREISDRMFARLDYIKYLPDLILDAGSGTGYGTQKLGVRYPNSYLMAVDIARSMLQKAKPIEPWWYRFWPFYKKQTYYICADIECLPVKDGSVGMVWSNLALQWCDDLGRTFNEINRVLKTDGLFMFSTFGPDTLKELRHAFETADTFVHVNQFIDMHDIGDLLVHNRFATPVMDMEYITVTYDEVIGIMHDLKAIGAHNVAKGRQRGLTGKTKWQCVIDQYETLRSNGKLPATFEVIYGHAWKLPPKQSVITPEIRKQILMN